MFGTIASLASQAAAPFIQAAYNSPKAQIRRLQKAGLSKNAIFDLPNLGTMETAPSFEQPNKTFREHDMDHFLRESAAHQSQIDAVNRAREQSLWKYESSSHDEPFKIYDVHADGKPYHLDTVMRPTGRNKLQEAYRIRNFESPNTQNAGIRQQIQSAKQNAINSALDRGIRRDVAKAQINEIEQRIADMVGRNTSINEVTEFVNSLENDWLRLFGNAVKLFLMGETRF